MIDRELTMKAAWEQYQRMVVPRDASGIQVRETMLAFYAGARALQTSQLAATDEADLEQLSEEINQFMQAQIRRAQ